MRLEGLSAWKMEGIISTIPLLLQVVLVLFFVGMLELLWPLEKTVAIPFTVIAAFVILFILFTTLASSIQYCSVVLRRTFAQLPPQCPYKSSQAWLLTSLYHLIWKSIQNYDQRTHVFLSLAKNHDPGLFRGRNIGARGSNLELITSMAEEKSDEVYFEAMEQLEDRFRLSKLADQVLLRAYGEWSACSWDTRYKSPCNADFTAMALLYLSGQVGLSGLQHCLRLIKTHLTHPDVNDYNFVIPPGVHAPFNAHIVAVTSDVECLHASG
ncbi:hypothetical protein ARMSODRAFT_1036933 [Armillaria solidipes]|uniref:DUF6535 domain-containing protein n=1 Tax=Armillaria solidipes TaxID=1076256 RepID=A0A2H3BLA6_9AGAR|nr:hypothetical protein ARMSODRAFT_1036933 [Armillaria solidipes]